MMECPIRPKMPRNRRGGFTLVELMVTIAIIGVLASIAMPTFSAYRLRAYHKNVLATMRYVMDGEDFYYQDFEEFYPERGRINIPRRVGREIPELAYTFTSDHLHQYIIYGRNVQNRRRKVSMYFVEVRADYDFNGNGRKDRFRYTTLIRNGKTIRFRELRQFR